MNRDRIFMVLAMMCLGLRFAAAAPQDGISEVKLKDENGIPVKEVNTMPCVNAVAKAAVMSARSHYLPETKENAAAIVAYRKKADAILTANRAYNHELANVCSKLVIAAEQASQPGARVTVQVRSAPFSTFLDTLSEQAKINFIIKEGFEGETVTADLKNVEVRQVLDFLADTKGLKYRKLTQSATYVIARSDSKPRFECGDLPRTPVSLRASNEPLVNFLVELASQAKIVFSIP